MHTECGKGVAPPRNGEGRTVLIGKWLDCRSRSNVFIWKKIVA